MCWVYYKNIMENLISFVTIKFLLASFRKKEEKYTVLTNTEILLQI